MLDKIKVDLGKATLSELVELLQGGHQDIAPIIKFCDKVIQGGVKHRNVDQLPMIMSAVVKALNDNAELVAIAMASMNRYLNDDDDG